MNKYLFIIGVYNVEQQLCGIIVDIFAQNSCVGKLRLLAYLQETWAVAMEAY